MNLREKFQIMRKVIATQQEITETDFILELDDLGIGQATYNKIKRDFRINALKTGINYDEKEKTYRIGTKQQSLTTIPVKERQELV